MSVSKNEAASFSATTASRQAIMDRLRTRSVPSQPLTPIDRSKCVRFDDPLATFVDSLEAVGAEAHLVSSDTEIQTILDEISVYRDASRIASLHAGVAGNVDAAGIDDPHALSSLDWTIAEGQFGVAENGAIWIDGATLPHRVMLFISQYLAIVISRRQIVHHMHEAYDLIGMPTSPFGIFVSGPSKTADIEQSLVIGAHGCRKLQVFLLP